MWTARRNRGVRVAKPHRAPAAQSFLAAALDVMWISRATLFEGGILTAPESPLGALLKAMHPTISTGPCLRSVGLLRGMDAA
ncbi:hypothetical protein XAB3213_3870017 [Xanthomonas citri pv. bilvae]|nr:hypothetical protein XAB3213_3870017 [Xanthomonas citri pv. bilvae]